MRRGRLRLAHLIHWAYHCTIGQIRGVHPAEISFAICSFMLWVDALVLLERSRNTCICILDILPFPSSENRVLEESAELISFVLCPFHCSLALSL